MAKVNREREASLTQARLKEVFKYSPETGEFTWIAKSSPKSRANVGAVAGSTDYQGYIRIRIDGYTYRAHRLVWRYVHNCFPEDDKPFIDHIDGDKSNNRVSNLRLCSNAENMMNRDKPVNNLTGYKGVSYSVSRNKYRASICNPSTKKNETLGYFKTPEEASLTYQKKASTYFGEFYPNVPIKEEVNE